MTFAANLIALKEAISNANIRIMEKAGGKSFDLISIDLNESVDVLDAGTNKVFNIGDLITAAYALNPSPMGTIPQTEAIARYKPNLTNVKVLVLDTDVGSDTINTYINSEAVCTVSTTDGSIFTVYNNHTAQLTFKITIIAYFKPLTESI